MLPLCPFQIVLLCKACHILGAGTDWPHTAQQSAGGWCYSSFCHTQNGTGMLWNIKQTNHNLFQLFWYLGTKTYGHFKHLNRGAWTLYRCITTLGSSDIAEQRYIGILNMMCCYIHCISTKKGMRLNLMHHNFHINLYTSTFDLFNLVSTHATLFLILIRT